MARRYFPSASSRTITSPSALPPSGSRIGVALKFGLSASAASALATLFDGSGSTSACTEIWTLVACPFTSVAAPLERGFTNGLYVYITGAGACAMVEWG